MRTSKEMADLVFQIRDEHLEKKNRFRIIKKVRKEGKTFCRKLGTIIVSKAQSIKKEPFRYSTAAASLLGVVGVGVGAIAMWQAIKEPLPDNIDPRPPIIVHTTASSQTTTTINTTETTVTTITAVSASETAETVTEIPKVIVTTDGIVTDSYADNIHTKPKTTTTRKVTTLTKEYLSSDWWNRQYERQGNEMHQAYYKIDEFLCKGGLVYSIDAESYMNGWGDEPGDNIVVEYINDEAKKAVEDFIEKNKINREWLDIHEMPYSEKCLVISINRVNQFICQNDLSCRIEPINGADEYTEGLNITYYALYEDDKKAVEQYITERGYDKIMPITYTMLGDSYPSVLTTDADEIKTVLESLAAEKGINVSVRVVDHKWMNIVVGDTYKDSDENRKYINDVMALMDENNLDRSCAYFYPYEREDE